MSFLLDTDICVEILRKKLNLVDFLDSHPNSFISSITVAELYFGVYNSQNTA